MSLKDFWQNAIKYRLAGGHSADHAAMGVPSAVRSSAIRTGGFGDSTAVIGSTQSPANQDVSVINVPFPASGQVTSVGLLGNRFALPMHYPQAYCVFSGGVAGQTTTQMLGRDINPASATREAMLDACNSSLDLLLIRAMVNDVAALTAAGSTQADVDAIWARYLQLLNRALAGVPVVMAQSIAGYSPTGASEPDLAFRRAAILYLNAKLAALPAQYPGRVYYCDLTGVTLNADGSYVTACSDDGIHDNAHGAWLRGNAEAALLAKIFGPSSGPRYKGLNLFANPLFVNTSTTGQGVVATGVSLGGGSVNVGSAQIEVIDGVPWQTAVYTPTVYNGNANGYIRMLFDPNALGWLANDTYGIEFDFSISMSDGSAIPVTVTNGMSGSVNLTKTGAGQITVESLYGNTAAGVTSAYKGRCVFPPFKTPEAGSALASTCNINLQSYFPGSVPLKLGMSMPRLVKL